MTQITVEFVNQPSKNPKFGSIKGADGVYYSIGAGVLERYRKGMSFDAPVTSRDYNGKTYYSIPDSFDPSKSSETTAAKPAVNGHSNGNGQTKDAAMFVMGVVGRSMGSGKFETQDIPLLAKAALAAWNEIKGSL